MGRTSKPLHIVVSPDVWQWAEIQAYRAQGHTVEVLDLSKADLILGPTAHRMSEAERKWLPNAITEARRRRYPKAVSEEETETP